MSYELNLHGFTAPERFDPDDALITQARIEEAAAPSGPWSVIEGPMTLSPAMTDPTAPLTYNFTTADATLEVGWYRVVWVDGGGGEVPTDPVELRRLSPYAPTVGDVASILRARLVALGGVRVTTFTDLTEPTAQEVAQLISLFAPLVFARTGALDTLSCASASDLRGATRTLIAQRVAIEVEMSYRPEEVGETSAAANELRRAQIEADLEALVTAIQTCRDSDTGGPEPESDSPNDPAWYFNPRPILNW